MKSEIRKTSLQQHDELQNQDSSELIVRTRKDSRKISVKEKSFDQISLMKMTFGLVGVPIILLILFCILANFFAVEEQTGLFSLFY